MSKAKHAHHKETHHEQEVDEPTPSETHEPTPKREAAAPAEELCDSDGTAHKPLLGSFVHIKESCRIGYLKEYNPKKELPARVEMLMVNVAGQGLYTSPIDCKLCDIEYLCGPN